MELEHESCYRAFLTRNAQFDGVFFVGVTTTRIYCRPVCTVRAPRSERCRFFARAAAAEQAGFRPCLRCRPELAPGNSSIDAVGRVARVAAARIEAGAVADGASLESLAAELGLGSRQLRRAVKRELGVSPVRLVQTHRLLLAKQLLTETQLPITEVALASGFESLRRFNASFRSHYRLAPRQLRRTTRREAAGEPLRLLVGYRPPLAWPQLLRFLAGRAIAGVEHVEGDSYLRTVVLGETRGWMRVSPVARANTLAVEFTPSLAPAISQLLAGVRHLFDLGARPDVISAQLAADQRIGAAVRRTPGLRVPGAFDGFELAWRAILGQQVSVRAASTLAARVAERFGEPIETPCHALTRLTPTAECLAAADLARLRSLGITGERARAIRGLAQAVARGDIRIVAGADPQTTIDALQELSGVGPWTAQYIAMRGLAWPDAFPDRDLALRQALGRVAPPAVHAIADRWRPWRAYGVMHIWNELASASNGRTHARSKK